MKIIDLSITTCPIGRRKINVPIQSIAHDISKLNIFKQILCTIFPCHFNDQSTDILSSIIRQSHDIGCHYLHVVLDHGRVLITAIKKYNDYPDLKWIVEKFENSNPNLQLQS
jgi:hypothetical protein